MREDNFLQKFHDLGSADEEKRCRAARGMTVALQGDRLGSEDLSYTIRRLVRGVQSSRQCCRQGFCLALAEVLQAFPHELATVLKLVDQTSELQSGLKATEQKERLLGRLLVYAAVLQAGSLRRRPAAEGGSRDGTPTGEVVSKLGRGLLQVYNARPYMAPVAVSILADTCGDLCQGGHYTQVPEVIAEWKLDEKVGDGEGMASLDGNVCGLVIGLRNAYEDTIRAGVAPSSLKSWPSCVRKDVLQGDALPKVAKNLGKALAALPVGDPVPPLLGAFCAWWVRPYKGRDPVALQERIWPAFEEGLFPDQRSPAALAQGFRGMAELATQLRGAGDHAKVDEVLAGFFQQFQRGWKLLLEAVAWSKAPAYQSALHAHSRLVAVVGGHREGLQPLHPKAHQKRAHKQKQEEAAQRQGLDEAAAATLRDETRLTILEALQSRQEFQKVPGNLQRQWQQALLAPLSPPGVRSRCGSLVASIAKGKGPATRVAAAQLEQLALHSKAPDEVILAVVFLQFTAAFFRPKSQGTSCIFSLRSFKEEVGLPTMPAEDDDVEVPVVQLKEEERADWCSRFWSALGRLSHRTLPEAAQRVVSGEVEPSANEAFSGGEDGPGSLVRSHAYQGCLGDGSYLILRLHQWWDHILSQAPTVLSSPTAKKRKKSQSGCLDYLMDVKEARMALRNRAVESCKSIIELSEGRGGLSFRQKNAICIVPLSMSLALIDKSLDTQENAEKLLTELLNIVDEISRVAKTTSKTRKKLQENLAAIPPVAAELFVAEFPALVREAAKMAWRELGFFASEDTLTGVCGSVCGTPPENEPEEGEEDDEDEVDEPLSATGASRKAAFDSAITALKVRQDSGAGDDEEEDEDVTTLDTAGVLNELLGGEENDELLESFAGSGLQGVATQPKTLTKRQLKLRDKQNDAIQRLREVELMEAFLLKHGGKRPASLDLVQELFSGMVRLMHKAKANQGAEAGVGDKAETEQGKGKHKRKKMQSKADVELRNLEDNLAQRIHKLLQKLLKNICRAGHVQILAGWHSPEQWASKARRMYTLCQTPNVCLHSGPRPLEIGSGIFYFFCAAHQAASQASEDPPAGWALAEELLASLLQEWGGKKDCDSWCQTALKAFAVRTPQLLQKLPWVEAIRSSRKAYTQRMQLAFVATNVLRPHLPGAKQDEVAALLSFADSFAALCAELVASTLGKPAEEGGNSTNQMQKLRREALQALKSALRVRQKSSEVTKIPPEIATTIASAVAGLRDSLPNQRRQGEVYQLCVHILRIVRPQVSNQSSKRQLQAAGERPAKRARGGSEPSGRGRSASASRSPSMRPQASPRLKAASALSSNRQKQRH